MNEKPERGNRHILLIVNLILLAVIIVIAVVAVYRLYKWNKGTPSDYDPDNVSSDFDVEVLDEIYPLNPALLEGHEDDGVTTILCLGDDPFITEKGTDAGLAEQIAQKSGATVYNGAFKDSRAGAVSARYNSGYWMDSVSIAYLTEALCTGDFSRQLQAAEWSTDEDFAPTVDMLQNLDMNTVDILCIMYDGADYVKGTPSDDPNDAYNIVAYTGALRTAIEQIQETYPFIRIVLMSHTFCFSLDEDGNFQNGDRFDLGNGTLSHYLLKEIDVAMDTGVSLIDNFYGSVNEDNYQEYMTDYIHFNDEGLALLAQRFVDCILPDTQ